MTIDKPHRCIRLTHLRQMFRAPEPTIRRARRCGLGIEMTIATVVQDGKFVRAYDKAARKLCYVQVFGSGPRDGLKGYTATTFSVQDGNFLRTYDETGKQLSSKQV